MSDKRSQANFQIFPFQEPVSEGSSLRRLKRMLEKNNERDHANTRGWLQLMLHHRIEHRDSSAE
jgi:hypothetical protein